jgi:hypothetical protein
MADFVTGFLIQIFLVCLISDYAHGWGWYNYTEAIIYTQSLNGSVQNPGGKWTDFCDYFNDNICYGIFCDVDQYIDDVSWQCNSTDENDESQFNLGSSKNEGFVFFHDDSPNYTMTTKSQEYFKELKARMNRYDPTMYIQPIERTPIDFYLNLYNTSFIVPFRFETETMPFFALDQSSQIVLIDYNCSLIDTRFRIVNNLSNLGTSKAIQLLTLTSVIANLSLVCWFLVVVFYALIRELRNNIIGKFVLVLTLVNGIKDLVFLELKFDFVVSYIAGGSVTVDYRTLISTFIENFIGVFSTVWFLAMVYETFVLLK